MCVCVCVSGRVRIELRSKKKVEEVKEGAKNEAKVPGLQKLLGYFFAQLAESLFLFSLFIFF